MNELLLHAIWKYQFFQKGNLQTAQGEAVNILKQGNYNTDAGPDFLHARIQIGETEWNGHVEIHVHSSDWNAHKHQENNAYQNVILHAVWENNKDILRPDGTLLPVLELKPIVNPQLLENYKGLAQNNSPVPCSSQLSSVASVTRWSATEQALVQRLEKKSDKVLGLLKVLNDDWEETAFQLLAQNFGLKINAEPFHLVAQSIPIKTIRKHLNNLLQTEALLFGQAGMLSATGDEYARTLKKEYEFLKHKYSLEQKANVLQWKFLRLRPANFPTIRMAQLAALLQSAKSLWSSLMEINNFKEAEKLFAIETSPYWKEHYRFGKKSAAPVPAFGKDIRNNILINTLTPLWAAYGRAKDEPMWMEKALMLLQHVPGEKNRITKLYEALDWKSKTAFDSQGLIELHNEMCMQRKCLDCAIGIKILGF